MGQWHSYLQTETQNEYSNNQDGIGIRGYGYFG